jgi:hypothetical protein
MISKPRRFTEKWYWTQRECLISGFRRDADEICAPLGFYAALNGSFVPTFRDNLSVPSSRVKQSTNSFTSQLLPTRRIVIPINNKTYQQSLVELSSAKFRDHPFNRSWAGPRHVGAQGQLIIWHHFKPIYIFIVLKCHIPCALLNTIRFSFSRHNISPICDNSVITQNLYFFRRSF